MHVLIAEDEPRLAALLAEAVRENSWEATVCSTGTAALAAARVGAFDVLLLDWMLPGLDGPGVIDALRRDGHRIPILLLTARADVRDRVDGLDSGADDYLAKPFDLEELLARLRALHRRGTPGMGVALRAGDLFLEPVTRRVERGGTPIELSAREFDILRVLLRRAGQVVTRYQILDEVWDGVTDVRSNVIDVHIATLRGKVDKPFGRAAIGTIRGAGYRLDPGGG